MSLTRINDWDMEEYFMDALHGIGQFDFEFWTQLWSDCCGMLCQNHGYRGDLDMEGFESI